MPEPIPTIGVTGGSGFIGGDVLNHLSKCGHATTSLGRRPAKTPGIGFRPFELGPEIAPEALQDLDTLVHCAYDFSCRAPKSIYRRNVVGTVNLLRAAQRAGVRRIVFISSMSAYDGTSQIYGRAKLESERLVAELGGVSLRLGLVWGSGAGGMAGAVQRLTGLPIVPVLDARSHQFAVHRDDVSVAIERAITDTTLSGVLGVAHPSRVPVPRLLAGLGALDGGRTPGRFLPVPWRPVYWAMRAAEAIRVPLPLRADSVLGLVRPARELPGVAEWAQRGMSFRPFPPA